MNIAVPVSWQSIGYLICGGVATAFIFLSIANFSRSEIVVGTIAPDIGAASVLPTRAGVITGIAAHEGEMVAVGAQLALIRAEEDSVSGASASELVAQAIMRQDSGLAAQSDATLASARAQQAQIAVQQAGLASEIGQIEAQMSLQRTLVTSAQADLDRAREVAERGFISQRDLQVREETFLVRQQGLAQLGQSLAAKQAALAEAERNSVQTAAQARAQGSALAASRAQVAQQAASMAGSRSYVLRAPVAGRVTALTARVGQPANPQSPLMTIVPTGSVLRAELSVPSAAIGFVKVGQEVRLAIDAFPYQRFGTVTGRIVIVASSPVAAQGPNGTTVPVYPVSVALDTGSVRAFGRSEPLVSGMTLSARIITERQSLLEWLFEPLYAVARR